jgi:predicted dinucleotide-binding enzyme
MTMENHGADIGIIGAGHLGQAFARLARRADREVVIANSRLPESLSPVIAELGEGVSAVTADGAAAAAIVVIAVPWANVATAVSGESWNGQIVVDVTNAILIPSMKPAELDGRTSS